MNIIERGKKKNGITQTVSEEICKCEYHRNVGSRPPGNPSVQQCYLSCIYMLTGLQLGLTRLQGFLSYM